MKEGWENKKLGEVCNITMGQSPDSSTYNKEGIGLPFFQGCADFGTVHPRITTYCSAPKKIALSKDILMSVRAPIGTLNIANDNCCIGRGLAAFSEIKNISDYRFIFYFLKASQNDLQSKGTGATFKAIGKELIINYPISLPPLSEQQQIVEELDLLSSIIEKKKEQLKELDNLAQSIFYDMFGDPVTNEKGWKKKKIGELASVKTGPFGSMLHKEDYISKGIPLVNPIHIKDFHIVADMDFTISDEKAEELNKYILQKDDVVFARRGDIGRCAVVSEEENGYLCGTGSLFVRFMIEVASTYIMYIIRSSSFTKEIISNAKGATMLNLNSSIIENLWLPLPPISLQQQFASKIEAIEKQKKLIKQSIKEVETLFNSRMDYYFN